MAKRSKRRARNNRRKHRDDVAPQSPESTPSAPEETGEDRPRGRRFEGIESLEARILMSATWADADTGDPIPDATEGDDIFYGDGGDNTADGLGGDDTLFGADGDDHLDGGAGNDTLEGGTGDDTLIGGEGDDVIDGGSGWNTVDAGEGNNTVDTEGGNDVITAGSGDDVITSTGGANTIDAGAGANTVTTGSGADDITTGGGDDVINAGGGNNTVNAGGGNNTVDAGGGNDDITTGSGDDVINAGGGANTIDAGDGNNTVTTGGGADDITTGAGSDVISAGSGNNVINAGAGDDVIIAGGANDTIDAGDGRDTVDYSGIAGPVDTDLTAMDAEIVIGSAGDDVFHFGTPRAGETYVIDGGGGANIIELAAYGPEDMTFDHANSRVTVDMGGGDSFVIEFTNVHHFELDQTGQGTPLEAFVPGDQITTENGSFTLPHSYVASGTGETVTYSWTQVAGPPVTLSDGDTLTPTIDLPEYATSTIVQFELTVSDGTHEVSETVKIAVSADNDPVVIDLGDDLTVQETDDVTLNATVVDPEGYDFIYEWTQVSGPTVELQDADTLSPSFTAPELLSDTDIVFELTASDGETTVTEQITVTVEADDDPVTADAGPDRSVEENAAITLNGTGADVEGQSLTYSWRQISGIPMTLNNADTASPSFTAPEGLANSNVVFELTVSDGVNEAVDTVTVTINADDDAPTITSAPDQTATEGDVVNLSVAATDPEGAGYLSYNWTQIGGPAVTLTDADTDAPSFTAPERISNTYLRFQVEVSDGTTSAFETVYVLVNADNDAPTADAGPDQAVAEGDLVTLAGDGVDPENQTLSYVWTQTGGPDVDIINSGSASPTFYAPDTLLVSEEVTFQLEVTDGVHTVVDTVTITVDPELIPGGNGNGNGGVGNGNGNGNGNNNGGGNGGGGGGGGRLTLDVDPLLDGVENEDVTLQIPVLDSAGPVTYTWVQTEGIAVTLDDASAATPTFTAPELLGPSIVTFEVTLDDGDTVRTETISVRIDADNDAASVTAGPDLDVEEDETVALSSTVDDPEDQQVKYTWTQLAGPTVALKNADTGAPTFTAPNLLSDTVVTFQIEINDGGNISTDTIDVMIRADDDAPTVNAGNNKTVPENAAVSLNPVVKDPEGQPLTYEWVQISGPTVTLSDPAAPAPTFTAPELEDDTALVFELRVSDGVHTVSDQVTITVDAENDPPTVDAGPDLEVDEDDLVTLTGTATDIDTDNLNWTWTQTGGLPVTINDADTATPTFTAPNSVVNSYLTFEVAVSDGETTVTDIVRVLVNADNDAPTNDAGPDTVVPDASLVTLAGSANDPDGQPLTHTWTQIGGPEIELEDDHTLTPFFQSPNFLTPTNFVFQLETTDGTFTTIDTVTITVDGVNDGAISEAFTFSTPEDTPVVVTMDAVDPDTGDAVEYFRLNSPSPHGVVSLNGDPLDPGDIITFADLDAGNVVFTPNGNWSGQTTFTYAAFDGEAWGDPAAITIDVTPVADAPIVDAGDAAGVEETAIDLDFNWSLTDIDGSETVSRVTVTGAPDGSTFSDGVNSVVTANGDPVDITGWDMDALAITPAVNWDVDFDLTLTVETTESANGDATTESDVVTVEMTGINDMPLPVDTVQIGPEDQVLTVMVEAAEPDTGDFAEAYRIDTLPSHGTLFVNGVEANADDEISHDDVVAGGLTFQPDDDWSGVTWFQFSASDGELWAPPTGTARIEITAVADAADLAMGGGTGLEDEAIPLNLSATLADTDGSETLTSLELSGAPIGSVVSDGVNSHTVTDGDPIDIRAWSLDAIEITPPQDLDQDFDITLTATTREGPNADEHTHSETFTVDVIAVNDAPTVDDAADTIAEDGVAVLAFSGGDVDTGDSIESYRIDAAPVNGTILLNGVPVDAGDVVSAADVAAGRLTYEPNDHWSGVETFQFSAGDGDVWSDAPAAYTITVTAEVDAPTLSVTDVVGDEDASILLPISSGLTDTDGSESLTITIEDYPAGTTFSAGTNNGDGAWSFTAAELSNLRIRPPADWAGVMNLTVTAEAEEAATGATTVVTEAVRVDVRPVADAAHLSVNDASGSEDVPVPLDISAALSDTDGSEVLSIIIGDVPADATLSAGTNNGDGTWTLEPDDLDGLTVSLPSNASGAFDLSITARAEESSNNAVREVTDTLRVTISGVADAPDLTVDGAVTGDEDSAIPLDINAALNDADGSETLTVTVADVPTGATLSAGFDNGDGTWSLAPHELNNLSITLAPGDADDFQLNVTAIATELDGDVSSTSATIDVVVDPVADAPTLAVTDATGTEDTPIPLDIDAALVDTDGSEVLTVTVDGVPTGAALSAGTDNGDGTWTLSAADLDGLTITPPAHDATDFTLTVTAQSRETENNATAEVAATLEVTVDAEAEAFTVDVSDAAGDEDSWISLDLSITNPDVDGSETTTVQISGLPADGVLSAGVQQPDGSWRLDASDLDGLSFRPPDDFNGDITVTVQAVAEEAENGDRTIVDDAFTIHVAPVNDAPVADAQSDMTTQGVPLTTGNLLAGASDIDGDTLTIASFTQPEHGEVVSHGDGTFTYTPRPEFAGDDTFTYTVSDGAGGEVTVTMTITVLPLPEDEPDPVRWDTPDARPPASVEPGADEWADVDLSQLTVTGDDVADEPVVVDPALVPPDPNPDAGDDRSDTPLEDPLFGAQVVDFAGDLTSAAERQARLDDVAPESLLNLDLEPLALDGERGGRDLEDAAPGDVDRTIAELERMSRWSENDDRAAGAAEAGFLPALWGLLRAVAGVRRDVDDETAAERGRKG